MSQHDFSIANQTASSARSDINNALQALASNNSGTAAPSTTYANMLWYETDTNRLYMRNEANTAWLNVAYIDQSGGLEILDNTQVVNTSGTQTGLLGDQSTATWQAGTGTTQSLVSPANVKAAVIANASSSYVSKIHLFDSSDASWSPVNTGKAIVCVVGAGGSGAATIFGNSATGGGGGGACFSFIDLSSANSYSITVGSGGASVGGSASNGKSGSLSRFTGAGITMTANGGSGGTQGNGTLSGASGGTASGGQINLTGGSSGTASSSGTGVAASGGGGSRLPDGGTANGTNSTTTGNFSGGSTYTEVINLFSGLWYSKNYTGFGGTGQAKRQDTAANASGQKGGRGGGGGAASAFNQEGGGTIANSGAGGNGFVLIFEFA